MDVEETVTAIIRALYEKSTRGGTLNAEDVIEDAKRKIMLVYYTAFSESNDQLIDYLPPLEHDNDNDMLLQ